MGGEERAAAADYITDLTKELAAIAFKHQLDLVGYLLDLAAAEASDNRRGLTADPRPPAGIGPQPAP
jgi:hypothetical protein